MFLLQLLNYGIYLIHHSKKRSLALALRGVCRLAIGTPFRGFRLTFKPKVKTLAFLVSCIHCLYIFSGSEYYLFTFHPFANYYITKLSFAIFSILGYMLEYLFFYLLNCKSLMT